VRRTIYIFVAFLFVACQKDPEIPQASEDPVFYMTANVDEYDEQVVAGAGDYFMFTDYKRYDSILHLQGILKQYDCQPCVRSFEMSWAEHDPNAGFDPVYHFNHIHPTLLQPEHLLVNEMVEVNFFSEPKSDLGVLEYVSWDFGNGDWSTELHPTRSFLIRDGLATVEVFHNMTYITDDGQCTYRQSNTIDLDSECQSNFTFKDLGNGRYQFVPLSSGIEPASYEWRVLDTVLTETSPIFSFKDDGAYNIELKVSDENNNCSSSMTKRLLVGVEDCEANWHYTTKRIFTEPSDSLRFGKISLSWTDAMGIRYQSDLIDQDSSAYVIVDRVIPFRTNDEGEQVMQIKGRFQCKMRATNSGKKINFTNGSFSIGLAYPN
jgi:hypothetical protein